MMTTIRTMRDAIVTAEKRVRSIKGVAASQLTRARRITAFTEHKIVALAKRKPTTANAIEKEKLISILKRQKANLKRRISDHKATETHLKAL